MDDGHHKENNKQPIDSKVIMKTHYIKQAQVKAAVKAEGKRISQEALKNLDAQVHAIIRRACAIHNGGRKTIDATVLAHVK